MRLLLIVVVLSEFGCSGPSQGGSTGGGSAAGGSATTGGSATAGGSASVDAGVGNGPPIRLVPDGGLDFGRVDAGAAETRTLTVENRADAGALFLGVNGQQPYLAATALNANSLVSEICIGEFSGGTCTGTISSYNPAVGLPSGSQLSLPIRVMPADSRPNKAWQLEVFSNSSSGTAVVRITASP